MLPRTRIALIVATVSLVALVSGCDIAVLYRDSDGYEARPDDHDPITDDELLAVVSPSGGRFTAGETLTIGWQGSAEPYEVTIDLYLAGSPLVPIARNLRGTNRHEWTIPSDLVASTEVSDEYQIVVSGYHGVQTTGELLLVAFSEPFTLVARPTGGLSDVTVSRREVQVTLTDNGQEIDGDTVDVFVNGEPVALGHVLTEAGTSFALALRAGENLLEIRAVNEGSVSPNTALLEISDVVEGLTAQQWRLAAGEYGRLTITAP